MQIKIQNYEILNFENYSLIGSEKGISRIKSENLVAALSEIQHLCDTPINMNALDLLLEKHNLEKEPTLTLLRDHLVIETNLPTPYFDATYVLHGWSEHQENTIKILDDETSSPLTHLPLSLESLQKITCEKSLIVILPASQNTQTLKDIYFAISSRHPKSFIICGYFSPLTFTVTQPFSTDLGNPCLFCSLSRAIHFESQAEGVCGWSAILKFCTSNTVDFTPPKISTLQLSMVTGLVARKIETFLSSTKHKFFQDNILSNSSVSLSTGVTSEETLPHWHMCDCLRANYVERTA